MGWSNDQFIGELTIPTGATTGARITINHNNDGAIKVYDAANTLVAEISPAADVIKTLDVNGLYAKLDPSTDSFIAGTPGPGLVLGGMSGDVFPGTLTEYDDTFSRGLYLRTPSPSPLVPVDPVEGIDYASIRMTGRFHGNDPQIQLSAGSSPDAPNGSVSLNALTVDAMSQIVSYRDAVPITPGIGNIGTATFSERTGWYYRIGPMRYVVMYFVVNNPGSGAGIITPGVPFTVDRSTRQTLTMTTESTGPNGSHIGNGTCTWFPSGSGGSSDRCRTSSNDGTNRDLNITGADLLAGGIITIEGWLRESI
jgi:hypothetical protein